jgi:hypothetical protein
MLHLSVLGAGLIFALLLYKTVTWIVANHRQAMKAKSLGCEELPIFPSPDPLGLVNVWNLYQANEAGRLCEYASHRNELMSKREGRPVFTFQLHIARNWLYFSCDPACIQAMLATQFKDFELGPIRFGTFSPL